MLPRLYCICHCIDFVWNPNATEILWHDSQNGLYQYVTNAGEEHAPAVATFTQFDTKGVSVPCLSRVEAEHHTIFQLTW